MLLASTLFFATVPLVVTAANEYHGNPTSKIYHNSSCRYFNCKNCIVIFMSREAAMSAGYRAYKICRG